MHILEIEGDLVAFLCRSRQVCVSFLQTFSADGLYLMYFSSQHPDFSSSQHVSYTVTCWFLLVLLEVPANFLTEVLLEVPAGSSSGSCCFLLRFLTDRASLVIHQSQSTLICPC